MHPGARFGVPARALLAAACLAASCARPEAFLAPSDRIVIVGNALADRMQHHGWLETHLQAALPGHRLVVRNHGYTGDRVDHRPRNEGFPDADWYLAHSRATVILAMFGYNESFDEDPAGFRRALLEWIAHVRARDYSGEGPPRVVLVSPVAHEPLPEPQLPDGSANNRRLAATTVAMRAAAAEAGVRFVDLFTPTLERYAHAREPLTVNGVHLNERGNRVVARILAGELLGREPGDPDAGLAALRRAVLDKNRYWFHRYRATDGNDVWGSRAALQFTAGQTNREVLQHELEQLDVMTANRDEVVWAAARGEAVAPDDANVPPPIPVETNLHEPQTQGGVSKLGDGSYLGAEEAIGRMTLADGLRAKLYASEERFPELVNPVQLGVDPRGRLWAAAWRSYPKWQPLEELDDRLLILPDEDRDGVADRAITFARVHNPTGFTFWNGGVIVASAPDLLFLKDEDGDDVADVRRRILGGLDSADTHHTANNFVYGPDGWLYYQRGIFNVSNVETPWQANQESARAGMYRFQPRSYAFAFHAENGPNPHGAAFDRWGHLYATDGTGGRAYQVRTDGAGGFAMHKLLDHTVRPVASSGILSSAHFPPEYEQSFLICNTIAFLGIKRYVLEHDPDSGEVWGTEAEDLLVSSDPNFRPTDVEVGADGALYVSDWCNAIIGHMQHNIRDPQRDHEHGRIYRITAQGRPLSGPVAVHGEPVEDLLRLLEHPVDGVRQRARVELSARDADAVLAAAAAWIEGFDAGDPGDAQPLLEALWLYQRQGVHNRPLLEALLASPEPHARLAARRVRTFWDRNLAAPRPGREDEEIGAGGEEAEEAASKDPPEGAIVLRAVPEEMRYDRAHFTVPAGEEVRLWFENPDTMPHNVVVGEPGSAEELGRAAEALGAEGFAGDFVPDSDRIVAASRLLQHGEAQLLSFVAPAEPGDYDFVCTFPGHWQRMRGVMRVRP